MIYLDNAATSWPKPPGTADAVAEAILHPLGNPGRTSHGPGIAADRLLFGLREILADFLKVKDSSRILFTSGTTQSVNTVLYGFLKPGDRVLTSSMEHNAVMRPLRHLEETRDITVLTAACSSRTGFPDLSDFARLLKEHRPSLAVFTAASNVNGIVFPFEEMADLARRAGTAVCVDAAQAAGEVPLFPEEQGIDFLCFSGHKGLLGPAGTGGLYLRDPERVNPLIRGGTGSRSSEEKQPGFLPDRFESGTPNIPGFAGWLRAMEYLISQKGAPGTDSLFRELVEGLSSMDGIRVIGRPEPGREESLVWTRVVSIRPERTSLTELTAFLDSRKIAVRSGLHCAPGAHKTLGTFEKGGTVRLSPGLFTTKKEIAGTLAVLKEFTCLNR